MGPFDDLILYDIDPNSMTEIEKEILLDEMYEGGDLYEFDI
jgi:hypothetical protein